MPITFGIIGEGGQVGTGSGRLANGHCSPILLCSGCWRGRNWQQSAKKDISFLRGNNKCVLLQEARLEWGLKLPPNGSCKLIAKRRKWSDELANITGHSHQSLPVSNPVTSSRTNKAQSRPSHNVNTFTVNFGPNIYANHPHSFAPRTKLGLWC